MKLQHSILRVIYPVLVAIFLAFAWSKYDGSDIREPSPNTRELHTDVLYMNIPVDANVLAGMIGDKLQVSNITVLNTYYLLEIVDKVHIVVMIKMMDNDNDNLRI